ncbi:hypothetical protein [uncultured Winogradskyella sp.]|uniref:hypothetical protein n=1 Tax=uncultured Winogradskyella sp. TaxID=395353 RepID=UPI0026338809|nr:hypothetical protein [uncultured Winogradskyella sp.]
MNKRILSFGFILFIFSCANEKKTDNLAKPEINSNWIQLENNDSIQSLGFTQRQIGNNPNPFVYFHYKSDRFKGDGYEPQFRNETILIANSISEIYELPDSLVLQVMGESKGTFMKEQSNWNTPLYFNGEKWRFANEK